MYAASYIPESQTSDTLSDYIAFISPLTDYPPPSENASALGLEARKDMDGASYILKSQTSYTLSDNLALTSMANSPSIASSPNQHENAPAPDVPGPEFRAQELGNDTVSSSENHDSDSKVNWDAEVTLCDICYETAKKHEKDGNIEMAIFFFEETLKMSRWIWGDDHQKTLADKHNLAWIYRRIPLYAERSWEIMVDVLQRKIRIWGHDDPRTLRTKFNMACVYLQCGYRDIALDWHRGIWEKRKLALGDDHDDTKLSLKWLQYMCPRSSAESIQSISSA
jgi:hypothetical protein